MQPWLLLLFLLPVIGGMCFKEQPAPYRRLPYNMTNQTASTRQVIDFFECKIQCATSSECQAFAFDQGLSVCAWLGGPATTLTCTVPTIEWLKVVDVSECPIIEQSPINAMYSRNPKIREDTVLGNPANDSGNKNDREPPCGPGSQIIDVFLPDGSYVPGQNDFTTDLHWDDRLAAWIYTDDPAKPRYIRAAQCFQPDLSDPAVINATACDRMYAIWMYGPGVSDADPRENTSMPCDTAYMVYTTFAGDRHRLENKDAFLTCILGKRFLIIPVNGVTQVRELKRVNCLNPY